MCIRDSNPLSLLVIDHVYHFGLIQSKMIAIDADKAVPANFLSRFRVRRIDLKDEAGFRLEPGQDWRAGVEHRAPANSVRRAPIEPERAHRSVADHDAHPAAQ